MAEFESLFFWTWDEFPWKLPSSQRISWYTACLIPSSLHTVIKLQEYCCSTEQQHWWTAPCPEMPNLKDYHSWCTGAGNLWTLVIRMAMTPILERNWSQQAIGISAKISASSYWYHWTIKKTLGPICLEFVHLGCLEVIAKHSVNFRSWAVTNTGGLIRLCECSDNGHCFWSHPLPYRQVKVADYLLEIDSNINGIVALTEKSGSIRIESTLHA